MMIPVVMIHRGYVPYLRWALLQAQLKNERIVLLGDEANSRLNNLVEFHHLDKLQNSLLLKFRELYKHLSFNSYRFELMCFERWFVLLEYMKKNGCNSVAHLDSDVLLYKDFEDVHGEFKDTTLAAFHIPEQSYDEYRWVAIGHTSVWKLKGLQKFCEFILDTYQDKMDELNHKWNWHIKHSKNGGINDMTLLYLFFLRYKADIINLATQRTDATGQAYCYDLNLNSPENYHRNEFTLARSVFLFKTKVVKPFRDSYQSYNILSKENVLLANLHCQGKAKLLMFLYFKGRKTISDRMGYLGFVITFMLKRCDNFVKSYLKIHRQRQG